MKKICEECKDEYEANIVSRKYCSLGCYRKHQDREHIDRIPGEIERLYLEEKLSSVEIANRFGVHECTINKWLNQIGAKSKKRYKYGKESRFWSGCGELSGSIFTKIKYGADKREIEFSVSIEYLWDLFLKQNRKCALSGLELILSCDSTTSDSRHYVVTASLDRIDNNSGYIEGNVQWVHKQINFMKHMMTQEEFISLCSLVARKYGVLISKESDINILGNLENPEMEKR